MSFYHSFYKILCIKPVSAISLSSNFSALSASRFTILQPLMLHHRLSWFMLLFFMFSHLCGFAVSRSHFLHLCLFVLHLQNVSDCQGLSVGVYSCAAHTVCIPILPHRCWLLRERASSVGTPHSGFMTKTRNRNFLWLRVHFTEANVRNTP